MSVFKNQNIYLHHDKDLIAVHSSTITHFSHTFPGIFTRYPIVQKQSHLLPIQFLFRQRRMCSHAPCARYARAWGYATHTRQSINHTFWGGKVVLLLFCFLNLCFSNTWHDTPPKANSWKTTITTHTDSYTVPTTIGLTVISLCYKWAYMIILITWIIKIIVDFLMKHLVKLIIFYWNQFC